MILDWQNTLYIFGLVFSSVLAVVVSLILWNRRQAPGAKSLSLMMLAVAIWGISIAGEAASLSIPGKILWSQIAYIGVTSSPPLLLIFAIQYTGMQRLLTRAKLIAVWIIPVTMLLMAGTNQFHNWIWPDVSFIPGTSRVIFSHGLGFWICVSILYAMLATASAILVAHALKTRNIYKRQTLTLLLGIPLPILWNVFYLSGTTPPGMDLTPPAFVLTGIIISWGIYREHLFDVIPIGKEQLIDGLNDGVIILDANHRVLDINNSAKEILQVDAPSIIGEFLSKIAPEISQHNQLLLPAWNQTLSVDPSNHKEVEIRRSEIFNSQSVLIGYSLFLRDITEQQVIERSLRESEQRYKDMLSNSASPVLILDLLTQKVIFSNIRLNHLLDLGNQLPEKLQLEKYFENKGELERIIRMAEKNQMVTDFEAPLVTRTTRKIWTLISANLVSYDGRTALFITFNDITSRKLVEEAERQQRIFAEALRTSVSALNSSLNIDEVLDTILNSLEKVIPHNLANIMLVDEEGNARIVRAKGYDAADLEKIAAQSNIQVAETPVMLKMALSGTPIVISDTSREVGWHMVPGMEWVRSYLGAPILVKSKLVGYINLDSTHPNMYDRSHVERLQIFADQAAIAIENARLFNKVEQMAIVDTLTGLYNRRHFYDLGEREIERNRRYHSPLALIMVDLDHFKEVNDRYGHRAGDQVLQYLAGIFGQSLRKMDIPGRIGGEEFVILLPETNFDGAKLVADRLLHAIAESTMQVDDLQIKVTASMGISTLTNEDTTLQELISQADKAMYMAKQAGRNRVVAIPAQPTV